MGHDGIAYEVIDAKEILDSGSRNQTLRSQISSKAPSRQKANKSDANVRKDSGRLG